MRKFLFLPLFFIGLSLFAQDISISKQQSDVFKDKHKKSNLLYSVGDNEGGFVTIREIMTLFTGVTKEYVVAHYDSDLTLKNEASIDYNGNLIRGLNVYDGKVQIFDISLNRKDKQFKLDVHEAPLSTFKFNTESLIAMDEAKMKSQFGMSLFGLPFYNTEDNQIGEVYFSENRNFLCVNFDLKDKEKQRQFMTVFDGHLNKVYEKEFVRDVKDRLFEYEKVEVADSDGTLYLLGKVYENNQKRKKKDGKVNYHYEMHKLTPDEAFSTSFDTDENFVSSLFTFRNGNQIACAGFYSEKNEKRTKGVVRYDLDEETLEVTNKSFQPFSEEFMEDKYGKVKDKELRRLSYSSGFLSPKGDIVINAEEVKVTYRAMQSAGGGYSETMSYHYNDIISVKLRPDGELAWAKYIDKKQHSSGTEMKFISFSSTVVGDDTYFFINASDKVKKLKNDRIAFKQVRNKKASLFVIKVDNDGNYTYKNILHNKDSDVTFFVSEGITTTSEGNEIVFLGERKAKKQVIKLEVL